MKHIHKLKSLAKKNPKLKGLLDHEEYGQIHYIKPEEKICQKNLEKKLKSWEFI